MPATGGEPRLLTEKLDRTCSPLPFVREPAWDGDRIAFALEDCGNVHLYSVAADGSDEPRCLLGGERVITGFDIADGRVVHSASTSTTLSELFAGDTQLTEVGNRGRTWLLVLYAIPAIVAGDMHSLRKYIEHMGLTGSTVLGLTRTVVPSGRPGRFQRLLHDRRCGHRSERGSHVHRLCRDTVPDRRESR